MKYLGVAKISRFNLMKIKQSMSYENGFQIATNITKMRIK